MQVNPWAHLSEAEMAEFFLEQHQGQVKEALVIAEDMTADFFKLSPSHWRRAPYDILTRRDLWDEEISSHALALLVKYQGVQKERLLKSAAFDFYRVCLQDHNIFKALKANGEMHLHPLLIYIITHELVHIIRFSQFAALFDAPEEDKRREEGLVHQLTRKILSPLTYLNLKPIMNYYENNHGGWQYAHI